MKPTSPIFPELQQYEVVLAKDQPQYTPLPVIIEHGLEGRMTSRWTFTDQERVKIMAGEDIFIQQLTFGHPFQPIAVGLMSEIE